MATRPVERRELGFWEKTYVTEVARGIKLTTRQLVRNVFGKKDVATRQYPEVQRPYPERFRGVHRLTHRSDGAPRCVACLCCSTACPAQCIYIEPGEYPEGDARRGYERFPTTFVIDELRCVYCGFCVEACPVDAIRMDTGMHSPAYDSRDQFMFGKDMLMSFPGRDANYESGNTRHEPGDPGYPGIDREHGH